MTCLPLLRNEQVEIRLCSILERYPGRWCAQFPGRWFGWRRDRPNRRGSGSRFGLILRCVRQARPDPDRVQQRSALIVCLFAGFSKVSDRQAPAETADLGRQAPAGPHRNAIRNSPAITSICRLASPRSVRSQAQGRGARTWDGQAAELPFDPERFSPMSNGRKWVSTTPWIWRTGRSSRGSLPSCRRWPRSPGKEHGTCDPSRLRKWSSRCSWRPIVLA